MKSALKLLAITFASLVVVLMIGVAVVVWWVFTPEKITPVVQRQLNEMLVCETKVDRVELTFFSTFPEFALHLHGLSLVNPVEGAPSDTLVRAASACATVDVKEFFRNNAVVVRELLLSDASVVVYTNAAGESNYAVMPPSPEADTSAFELPVARLEIEKIDFHNVRLSYTDQPTKLQANLDKVQARMTVSGRGDLLKGKLHLATPAMEVIYDSIAYIASIPAHLSTDYSFEMNRFVLQLTDAEVKLNELPLELSVKIENHSKSDDLLMDIAFASEGKLPVKPVLGLIPREYAGYLEGMALDGKVSFEGSLKGVVSESALPVLLVKVGFDNSKFGYEGLPYKLDEMSGKVDVVLDLMDEDSWRIVVDDFHARTMNSQISGRGVVDDLTGDLRFDLKARGILSLADARPVLPDEMDIDLKGIARGNLNLKCRLSQLMNADFDRIRADGQFAISDFNAVYDTIRLSTRSAELNFKMPNPSASAPRFAQLHLKSGRLDIEQGTAAEATLTGASLGVSVSNLMDSTVARAFDVEGTIDGLRAVAGEEQLQTGAMKLVAAVAEDKTASGRSLKWIPEGSVRLKEGVVRLSGIEPDLEIPAISFDFTPDGIAINDSRLVIGYSDFQLVGTLANLDDYLNNRGLLTGKFDFTSSTTDVNYLMKLVDGFGYGDSVAETAGLSVSAHDIRQVQESGSSGPFMVPKGVDITLNVKVDEAFVSTDVLSDVRGILTVKDGMLGLESVLFTASAARMQLNALYHSPRRNHLFLGLDFHLTHIEIEELLLMIPDVDTIMPMLRSFGGRGEFHIAAETYLDSTYRFKPSTLLGVASVSGEDLVLMDGETFSEIAKILMFNKKTENRIDSLAAEFTIFQQEVDIYPFQIVMDKYKAVLSGKHNLDMNFNYHISVTDSPLPFPIGVDVSGKLDDLKIRPAKPRYARLYRPAQRREIDRRQLEIKAMIRERLTKGVK
jgi:hypothetical protein